MKLLRIGFLLLVLLMISTTLVSADGPKHLGAAEPMEFANGDACWMFDMDFSDPDNFNWYVIEDCSPKHGVYTNGGADLWHWSAHGQLPEGALLPEKTTQITYEETGFACYAFGRTTTHYNLTITKTGKFHINCHFAPDKWLPEE